MRRYLIVSSAVLAALVLLALSFVGGRMTAPEAEGATVIAAFRSDSGLCKYPETNEIYFVRWTVKGIESGICVKPDSNCARTAYVGGTVPKTCRDQGE